MKKFLINFIVGMVFMAVGTTALIFELNEFEYVDTPAFMDQNTSYKSEWIPLKEHEQLELAFLNDAYSYSYEWNYDDSLKDQVKITFSDGVSYSVKGTRIEITDVDYTYRNGIDDDWNRFTYFMEGLKKRKIYNVSDTRILITTCHENRGRIQITNAHN